MFNAVEIIHPVGLRKTTLGILNLIVYGIMLKNTLYCSYFKQFEKHLYLVLLTVGYAFDIFKYLYDSCINLKL